MAKAQTLATKSVTFVMETEKETKNTVKFVGEDSGLTAIYVGKDAIARIGNPASISVTIEAI